MRTITVGKEVPVVSPGVVGTGRESGYQGSRFWDDVGKPHMSKQEVDSLPVCHAHFRRHVVVGT